MAMVFDGLDATTRAFMLAEFDAEERELPYLSKGFSEAGRRAFPDLMREAIQHGDEIELADVLRPRRLWRQPRQADRNATRLGQSEFNTWYVRGLSARLLDEGIERCQIYRAAPAYEPSPQCSAYDGHLVSVRQVYDGHRATYWPPPGSRGAFSIPLHPGCHHSIQRMR